MTKLELLEKLADWDYLPDDTPIVLATDFSLEEASNVRVTEVAFCGDKLEFPDPDDYGTWVILFE